MANEMVTIPRKEYESLKDDSRKLACLEAGGVDNWTWYSESLQGCYWCDEDESEQDIYGDDA